jgi:hypothetical protein
MRLDIQSRAVKPEDLRTDDEKFRESQGLLTLFNVYYLIFMKKYGTVLQYLRRDSSRPSIVGSHVASKLKIISIK